MPMSNMERDRYKNLRSREDKRIKDEDHDPFGEFRKKMKSFDRLADDRTLASGEIEDWEELMYMRIFRSEDLRFNNVKTGDM